MKGALFFEVDIIDDFTSPQAAACRLEISRSAWPALSCLSSQGLVVAGAGVVAGGGRIRACCAGDDSNGCADGDQGAGAQAGNGAAGSCAGSASCRSCCWWHWSAANWSGGLSHCLYRSEQDCRSDQNFFHGISFRVKQGGKTQTYESSTRL